MTIKHIFLPNPINVTQEKKLLLLVVVAVIVVVVLKL